MCICGGCGKVIEKKFFYCPWCGYSRVNAENETGIELRCQQHNQKIMEQRLQKVEQLEDQLDELEKELSVLVLSVQMAR